MKSVMQRTADHLGPKVAKGAQAATGHKQSPVGHKTCCFSTTSSTVFSWVDAKDLTGDRGAHTGFVLVRSLPAVGAEHRQRQGRLACRQGQGKAACSSRPGLAGSSGQHFICTHSLQAFAMTELTDTVGSVATALQMEAKTQRLSPAQL